MMSAEIVMLPIFFGYDLILESQNWLFVREPEHFKGIENILIV